MARRPIVYSGSGNVALAAGVAHRLGAALTASGVARFSDGETYLNIAEPEKIRGATVVAIQSCAPNANERLMELLLLLDAIKRHRPRRLLAVLPFFPYRRQEGRTEPGEPISADLVCRLIAVAGATRMLVLDPHSLRLMDAFRVPGRTVSALSLLGEHWQRRNFKHPLVVAQDRGAVQRAQWIAAMLEAETILLEKTRGRHDDVEKLSMNPTHANRVAGATCLLIDDEINTAGTLTRALEVLRAAGAAEFHVAVTHAVFSGPALDRLKALPIGSIAVTDSIGLSVEKRLHNMVVLSVAPLLAEAIKAMIAGR